MKLRKLIKNQSGSAMIKVIVLGAALMGFSKFGLEMVSNLSKDEKRNNASIETNRNFELVKKYLQIKPICDKYANSFVNESITVSSVKSFNELTTINSLGLEGRPFAKNAYNADNLIVKKYEAKLLEIKIKRPVFPTAQFGSINSTLELVMTYGECFKPNGGCLKSELKPKVMEYEIPILGRYRSTPSQGNAAKTIRFTYCNIGLSDEQQESLTKTCDAVGGKLDLSDNQCKFPLYDPCINHREGPIVDIVEFEKCMVPFIGQDLTTVTNQFISFQESICRLDKFTAHNSAHAEGYNPAIMAKDPITGQTYVAEGTNTGTEWLVTTKYCENFKAWKNE